MSSLRSAWRTSSASAACATSATVAPTASTSRSPVAQRTPRRSLTAAFRSTEGTTSRCPPRDVGEGPAGGILTGSTPGGYATCPSGGATLKFEFSRILDGLALTDSGALSARRIQFDCMSRPFFGSYKNKYIVRSNAIGGDNPLTSFYGVRNADFTTGTTALAYTVGASNVAGSWATVLYRNATTLLTVNSPLPINGSICETLFSRHPSGDMRLYAKVNNVWYGSPGTVSNDVTYLNTSYIGIAPRGSYVGSITCFQGEMESQELNQ
jgi:hypothetical protein